MRAVSETADQGYDIVSNDLSSVNISASGISLFLPIPVLTPQLFPSLVCGGPQLQEVLPRIHPQCCIAAFLLM